MVRINLINPKKLADQHLIAEYHEILMLLGYAKKYPERKNIPKEFRLGKGHIIFFKDKLRYLKNRHEDIRREMNFRGFTTNKKVKLSNFDKELINDWKPNKNDLEIIKSRLIFKINNKKDFYRYHGINKDQKFFIGLLN